MKKRAAAAIFIAFAVILSGCEKPLTPGQTVSATFEAVRDLDRDTALFYIDYDRLMDYSEGDNLSTTDETTRLLVENLSCKIISEEESGETATVRAEITNLDLKPVFDEYVKEAVKLIFDDISSEKTDEDAESLRDRMQGKFIELLKMQSGMTTAIVDIKLEKGKGGFIIQYDDALQDAVFGGLSGEIRRLIEEGTGTKREEGTQAQTGGAAAGTANTARDGAGS